MKRIKSTADVNSTLVKAGNAVLKGLVISNDNAAKRYLKLYNKATAPTVGTDVPVVTILIPIGGTVVVEFEDDERFALGLGYGITGAIADADTTAIGANEVMGAIFYS